MSTTRKEATSAKMPSHETKNSLLDVREGQEKNSMP